MGKLQAYAAAARAHLHAQQVVASEERPSDSAGLALELEDLQNYLQQVQRYKTDPVVKPSVVHGYCVGQTLSFCEVVDGQPKLVYRFVTSSLRNAPPPLYRYYAPINVINSRNWSSEVNIAIRSVIAANVTAKKIERKIRCGGRPVGNYFRQVSQFLRCATHVQVPLP